MKRIAVITGASSGLGKCFVKTLDKYGKFDEIWVIARNREKLENLANEAPFPIKVLSLDLSVTESYFEYENELKVSDVTVGLLMNCSGYGLFDEVMNYPVSDNLNMIDLNCKAVVAMCQLTVPYMTENSCIVNISSVAAFQPIPYINIYGATKSFVLNFSRALNRELKKNGIKVVAVCPFWTKTNFFKRAVNTEKEPVIKKYIAMYDADKTVEHVWRELKRNKDVIKYGFVSKFQVALTKILPHSMIMDFWQIQQKLK